MPATPPETISEVAMPDASTKTQALLADLWRRNRPVIEARIATLDLAAAAGPLDPELHAQAVDVSHKLAGSLGMFGFERGTAIARELEELLDVADPDRARLALLAGELRTMLLPAS